MAREERGAESEVRGLNAMGNPEVEYRNMPDRGPEGDRAIGNERPGGILARGTESRYRKGMGGAVRAGELLRKGAR